MRLLADPVPPRPRLPAARVAGRGVADQAAAVRRALPRDVRRGPRPRRADRHRPLRAAQPHGRRERAPVRRRQGRDDPGGREGAEGVHRRRADGRLVRRGVRRHAAAAHRRPGGVRLVQGGQRRHVGLSVPHHGQRPPAARPRQPGADRHLRAARARGPLVRHHGAVGAAGRLVARRHHHPGRAPGRRHLPADRQQDVDLRRRPRADREHRPPGAGQDPRRSARREGHLAVRRPQVPGERRRLAGRAQRRRPGRAQPQDGLPRDDEHAAELRRGRAHAPAGGPAPSATWSASSTAA